MDGSAGLGAQIQASPVAARRTSPLISSRETRSPSQHAFTWMVPPGWGAQIQASPVAASRTSPLISSREMRSPSQLTLTWMVPPG